MLLTLVRRYSSTRIPAPAFTPLPSRKPMLGSRSVATTIRWERMVLPPPGPPRVPGGVEQQERSRCAHQRQGKDRPAPRRHAQEVVRLLGAVGEGHPVPRRVDAAGAFPARKPDPEVRKVLPLRVGDP